MNYRYAAYSIGIGILMGLAAVVAVATEKQPIPKKNVPALIGPSGGISFGETAAPSPADRRRASMRWAEMTQQEIDGLTNLLKAIAKKSSPEKKVVCNKQNVCEVPIMIVCKDPACEDLALNLDNAFESARWKSSIVIGTQFGVPDGMTVSSPWLADMVNTATGRRYAATVGPDSNLVDGEFILIGAKPRSP